MRFLHSTISSVAVSLLSATVWAVTPTDVARLGQDLTAIGAEKAGNRDGSIPTFGGMDKPLPGWSFGKPREDYWQFKTEKPLLVIDASNVDKYADKLTPGQIQLIKQTKGYTMPIYPTHRTCGLPDFVEQNTKEGAQKSAIAKDGWSLEEAVLPGVPFPIPSSGIEVMWNWLTRYEGVGVEMADGYTNISPRRGSDTPLVTRFVQRVYFPWAQKGKHSPKEAGGLQTGFYYAYTEPAALAGQGTMQRYYFNKDTDSWYYFTGQRRVRRLPAYSYDAPLLGNENEYPADTTYVFWGNPDRFDWKLIGKKEIYVPYNSFALQNFTRKMSDVMQPEFVANEVRRYELHRVWEIEGTVKAGVRHSTPKKTLYVDEDSWLVVAGDEYDPQGKLWRTKENHVTPQWDLNACFTTAGVYNNLVNGRYVIDGVVIGTGKDIKFYAPGTADSKWTNSYFTGENLGSISDR